MNYEFKVPDVGEGLHEVEIVNWLIEPGNVIQKDEPIVELQTDKSLVEISSPVAGRVVSLSGKEGDVIYVEDVLITIDQENKEINNNQFEIHEKSMQQTEKKAELNDKNVNDFKKSELARRVKAAPTIRKLARELGVPIEEVTGTGPRGRIMEVDVRKFNQATNDLPVSVDSTKQDLKENINKPASQEREEIIPFTGLRRKISEKMVQSAYTIPHVTIMEEVDVTKLVQLRKDLLKYAEKLNGKLTYLPFIVKAVTRSLKEFPYLNSTLDEKQEKLILKKYYHIGIATATKDGLMSLSSIYGRSPHP